MKPTTKTKPTTTAAPETRTDDTDKPVLAQVNDPAKLTPAKIDEIAGEHSDPTDPEQTANIDVAENLQQAKADAKSADEPERGYFHGQGGAFGV